MKVRFGFVSNSSTSNFLVIGIETKKFDHEVIAKKLGKTFDDEWKAMDYFYTRDAEFNVTYDEGRNTYYVGKVVYDRSAEDMETIVLTKEELDALFVAAAEGLKKADIQGTLKMITGIRAS